MNGDMNIARVEAIAVSLPMTRPMKMAGVVIRHAENLLVRVEAEDGTVGWGEAASAPTMTGEFIEGMSVAVDYLTPMLVGHRFDDLETIELKMNGQLHANTGAKAAIDMALHDLLGRVRNQPVHALLGPTQRTRLPVLWMLGTGDADADVAEARAKVAEGFVAFKIKVGIDTPEADAERTRRICDAIGGGRLICADVNQGWRIDQAEAYIALIGDAPLDFLEQPLQGDDVAGMTRLAEGSRVAIGCDEGIHSLFDIERHHVMRASAGCSLKTIKMGGLRAVHDAAIRCAQLGMKVNLACKIAESSIATAAVLHLGTAMPALDWAVSLSSQYLADDLVRDVLPIVDGHASAPVGIGLGIDVDEAKVDRYRTGVRMIRSTT